MTDLDLLPGLPLPSLSITSLSSTCCEFGLPGKPLCSWRSTVPDHPSDSPHPHAHSALLLRLPWGPQLHLISPASPLWSFFSTVFPLLSARNVLLIQILPLGLRLSVFETFSTVLAPSTRLCFPDFLSTYISILHQSVGYLVLNKGAHHLSCCHKILLLHYVLPAPAKSSPMEGCWELAQWAQPLLRKELKIFSPTCSYQHPRRSQRFTWGQGVGDRGIRAQSES